MRLFFIRLQDGADAQRLEVIEILFFFFCYQFILLWVFCCLLCFHSLFPSMSPLLLQAQETLAPFVCVYKSSFPQLFDLSSICTFLSSASQYDRIYFRHCWAMECLHLRSEFHNGSLCYNSWSKISFTGSQNIFFSTCRGGLSFLSWLVSKQDKQINIFWLCIFHLQGSTDFLLMQFGLCAFKLDEEKQTWAWSYLAILILIALILMYDWDIKNRPAYLYQFSRDIPILALNHDFPISCRGAPILEDAGIFSPCRFRLVLFRRYSRILPASCTYRQSRRCVAAINSPRNAMNQC